jgi:hypothetical protein
VPGFTERNEDGSAREDHLTPPFVLDGVRKVGRIVLDPAPNPNSLVNPVWQVNYPLYSGLDVEWGQAVETAEDVVFINPPYGRDHNQVWPVKFAQEAQKGTPMIALIAARTSEIWWHDYILGSSPTAILFFKGRIRHLLLNLETLELKQEAGAKFPSCLVYWGPHLERFKAAFNERGAIWSRPGGEEWAIAT